MSSKLRRRIKLAPGLFVKLDRGIPLISIDVKRCSTHLIKRGIPAPASILRNRPSCSTGTEKYADQLANPLSPQTTSSPAQPASGLFGSKTSQVKLIWILACAILCGLSGFWLISSRLGNRAESDQAILAEPPLTMTPEEGNESIGTCSGSETSRIGDFTADQKS
jgi:hypothetical protein